MQRSFVAMLNGFLYCNLYRPKYIIYHIRSLPTVGVNLICKIGSSYPDTAPEIEIEITDGLLPAQARELQQLANETAEANVGMPMGYTIAEAIREWLVENNISNTDGSMHANMLRRMDEKSKQTRKEVAIQEVCGNCNL
jgi:RWD domain